jgi:hypothetical protein
MSPFWRLRRLPAAACQRGLQQRSKSAALARLMKQEVEDIIAASPWAYRRRRV